MHTTVQIVQRLSPGGIETMALDFAKHTTTDEENYIISLEGSREEMLEKWPRLKQFPAQLLFLNKPDKFSIKMIFRLVKLLIQLKTNCLHTHHIGPLLYGGLAAKIAGIKKHIHTEHDAWHLENSKHRKIQKTLLLLCKPSVIADSHLVSLQLKSKLGLKKINTIYNGIDTNKFVPGDQKLARKHLKLPDNKILIGCAGRLEEVKGQKVLINALPQLPANIHLVFAGVGSTEQALKALTKQLKLDKRVHFLGLVEDMPRFYQSLDVFCLPSFNEGFPLSPLEAQSCGVPSLITDTGASKEAICPDISKLVTVGDSTQIKEKLMQMLHPINDENSTFSQLENGGATNRTNHDTERNKQIKSLVRNFVINIAHIEEMLTAYRKLKIQY